MPIKIADISNKQKPKNSTPIFIATNNEYNIAVITPAHSNILLFIKVFHKIYLASFIKISPMPASKFSKGVLFLSSQYLPVT